MRLAGQIILLVYSANDGAVSLDAGNVGVATARAWPINGFIHRYCRGSCESNVGLSK